jgi:hypothetical protein
VKTLVDLCLACAIVTLFALVSGRLQKPTPVVVWDAGQYYSMARQFAAGRAPYAESPYVFRVGVPWLVSKMWPRDPARGFFIINLASGFAIAVLLTMWLRTWGIASWIPLAMVALVAAAWHGPVRYIYYNPGYVDPPFIALLLVGLLLIHSIAHTWSAGKIVLLALLSTAGGLVRETMVLVPVCFLLVNGPVTAFVMGQRRSRPVPAWALLLPLVACVCAIALTHRMVAVDVTERSSMVQAAYQWLHKAPDSYAMGWLATFGPVLAIVAFDWRRALRFLADHEWLAAFFVGCAAVAFLGGSDTERFAFWSLPVVYLLLARAIERHANVLRSASLVAGLVVSQAVSARVFWGIPDPHAESVVALGLKSVWPDRIYGVLNRLFVIDSFHFNLWSSFGSRPFRLFRLGLYVVVTGGFMWAMHSRAGASTGVLPLKDGEVPLGTLRGARDRAEHGGVVE